MARQIKWTESAWTDLEEIAEYISRDSDYYAKAFIREIYEAAMSLSHMSERGRVVPEFNDTSIRELFVRNYRLIYKITNDVVFIVGFIHGARDLQSLLNNERDD